MPDDSLPDRSVDDTDPFEEFNRAMGAGRIQNPYPYFAEQRAKGAVLPADIRALMGLDEDTDLSQMGEIPDVFTAYSFDTVQQILRDGETFSSSGYAPVMGEVMGRTILEMDEPDHHAYRSLIQQAFTRREMERWEVDVVEPIVDEHIDAFVDRGGTGSGNADLVRELTFPFPVAVIAALLGLPRSDLPEFHRLAVELISVSIDYERAVRASKQLFDYLKGIVDDRRVNRADDMISVLAHAELDGQRLTDDEIISFLRLLLPAGAETTYRSSSNLLFGLLTHPDQLDAVRDDRALIPQAIEEGLRWEPPLLLIQRTVMKDVEIGGMHLPAGTMVAVNVASAGHDETRWENAEDFDIFRPAQQHLSFAFGAHMCLGMHLARMETKVVLEKVFDRLPGVRLDPDASPPYITGMTFRSPPSLPVVWG